MVLLILSLNFFTTNLKADPLPPEFIQFTPSATMGALYYPDPDIYPNPHIATLNMHRTANRLSHISMEEMAKRGCHGPRESRRQSGTPHPECGYGSKPEHKRGVQNEVDRYG